MISNFNVFFRNTIICSMLCLIFFSLACCDKKNERSLTLISDTKKNGKYDMTNFGYYSLLNNRTEDIEQEFDDKGRCIKETNPCISYATLEYKGDNKIKVKVYDLSDTTQSDKLLSECNFEFGDAMHAKAKWKNYDLEDNSEKKGYYMFEFDDKGRKTYIAEYTNSTLKEYKEFYYTDDDYKFYTYDSEGELLKCNEYVSNNLIESNNQYLADGVLESSDTKEYYKSGILKRHTRISGVENGTAWYNENGILIKSESFYDNGNPSVVMEYDDNGYLIKSSNYEYDNSLKNCIEYTNDEYGMPIYSRSESFIDNEVIESHYKNEYTLNNEGKPIEIKVYDSDNNLKETFTLTYDDKGNVSERIYLQN